MLTWPLIPPSYPSQPGIIVPPASNLTLSLSSHPSLQSALHCPLSEPLLSLSSPPLSFRLLCLSLHLHYSLYVQGAVNAWGRGQAPLQEELRDSHHEWRESCQSPHHIAAGGGSSSRGEWPHPDSRGGAQGKLTDPPTIRTTIPSDKKRVLRRRGAITVHWRQQKLNSCLWKPFRWINMKPEDIYIWEKKTFSIRTWPTFYAKKREKAVINKQRNGGLSSHRYKYLSFPIYAVKNKL